MTEVNILYPKIRELEKCSEIFSVKNVVITEKIHGKNMRIIIPARSTDISQIVIGGREITEKESNYGLGSETKFLRDILPLEKILEHFKDQKVTHVIYGELLGPGVQKGVAYTKEKEFRIFDISMADYLFDFNETLKICEELGLRTVPILYEGEPSKDIFDQFINVESTLAKENNIKGTTAEGVVIKANPILKNKFGEYVMCKYKSEGFEEKAFKKREEKPKVDISPLAEFASEYVVENRVRKMIDKMKEKGLYKGDMSDAKTLGDELTRDIETEEKERLEKILNENPQLNKKMLFSEVMKVAIPILKSIIGENA